MYKADGTFDDWDANHNGYYGEIGGQIRSGPLNIDQVDLNPDIAVGRVPASTSAEASQYVEKVRRYETPAGKSAWAKRLLFLASKNLLPDVCKGQEELLSKFSAPWEKVRLYSPGSPCPSNKPLNADTTVEAINNGVGFISFIGHGFSTLWDESITIDDLSRLTNRDALPIIFSLGCGTAEFATLPPGASYLDINGVLHPGGEPKELTEEQKKYLDQHGVLPPDAGETFLTTPPPNRRRSKRSTTPMGSWNDSWCRCRPARWRTSAW